MNNLHSLDGSSMKLFYIDVEAHVIGSGWSDDCE